MKKSYIYIALLAALAWSCSGSGRSEQDLSGNSPAEKEEATAVRIDTLKPQSFSSSIELTATMEAVMDAFISPEINGQIEQIAIRRGARVKTGQLLAKLNTDVTEKSKAEVKTSLELASKLFEKQKELWEQEIGSEIQYLEAKNAKESLEARLATLEKQLEMAHIRAPFGGIVDQIALKEGELASPGMQLLRLVNLDKMRVSANVSEAYLDRVRAGDRVVLEFDSYPDLQLEAPVSRLGKVIDPQTRTFLMEVEIPNPGEKLIPNMLSTVRMQDFADPAALVVPSIILREDFNGTFLFRVREQGDGPVAEKVYVEKGMTVQDRTMVHKGLQAGDRIITEGYNLVADGSPLRILRTNEED